MNTSPTEAIKNAEPNRNPKTWTRDPQKERFWRRMLAEYAESGLSIREFCRQRNLSYSSFGAWKRELRNRDRERTASGAATHNSLLPSFPDKVKDSRGRVIPSRLRKWVEESKAHELNKHSSVPFVPLKLVENSKPEQERVGSQIEVLSPAGFTFRLDSQANIEFVSKLLRSLENN